MNATRVTTKCWVGWLAAVGVGLMLVVLLRPGPSEPVPTEGLADGPALDEPLATQPDATEPRPEPTPSRSTAAVMPRAPELVAAGAGTSRPGVRMVRVRPGQTLATVNGTAITLQDLLPLPNEKAGREQIMAAERFRFLLNRAIDREVTFQMAQAQGVALTDAQRKRLADLQARSERREPEVFDSVQQNPANVEFEQRDATALLLAAALGEKAGVASPHVTAVQVESYYQQHQAEYGVLPAETVARATAWERIDREIRLKLAPQLQAQHEAQFQQFRERLKAAAQVVTPAS
jgi:hypothetical protein